MSIYMEDKIYGDNASTIKAIMDISKNYQEWQDNLKISIEDVSKETSNERKNYRDEIKKKHDGPLVDLLPFDYLGPLKGTFYERAHTMILAFLLDPKCAGKFSKIFLDKILCKAEITENIADYDIAEVLSEKALKTHNTSVIPDIKITLNNKVEIIIENKCMASESKDQTPKYVREGKEKKRGFRCQVCIKQKGHNRIPGCGEIIKDKIYLFLDYKGREAKCPLFKSVNYNDIKESLELAQHESGNYLKKGKSLDLLIVHYIESIKNMGKAGCIVSYSDLGADKENDKLSLVQCKYLCDLMPPNNNE